MDQIRSVAEGMASGCKMCRADATAGSGSAIRLLYEHRSLCCWCACGGTSGAEAAWTVDCGL